MLPAMTPAERVGLLMGARQVMPPDAFGGFLTFTTSLLDEANAVKLRAAFDSRGGNQEAA
jgi:hypothetical protein